MSSTSAPADSGAPLTQLVQAIPAVVPPAVVAPSPPPPSNGKLTLEDISKYFHVPIADAASNLGVCTSVLKRICRENGIIRWPYRKYLAGKTFDDIKKEAVKERAASSNTARQTLDASKMIPSASAGLSTVRNQGQIKATGQQGVSAPGNVLQSQGNKSSHSWSNTVQTQTKHIPTYFDDFKYGFPANGLSSASLKWWGSCGVESGEKNKPEKSMSKEEEKQYSCKLTNGSSECMMIDEQTDGNTKDNAVTIDSSASSLVSLRKRALESGRESLQSGITNCEFYELDKRKRFLLFQVFRSSLPALWKDGSYC